jgi:hypothetical protein
VLRVSELANADAARFQGLESLPRAHARMESRDYVGKIVVGVS